MLDFMLSVFSAIFQMDMRNHHDIPFALPLVMACITGFIIGFTILQFIGNEKTTKQAIKLPKHDSE